MSATGHEQNVGQTRTLMIGQPLISAALKTEAAAEYVGLSKSTLDKLRVTGAGPQYLKLGRAVRYRTADLDAWLAASLKNSTSDASRADR